MSARRIEITVSEETWQKIEAARGKTPRAAWIKEALGAALYRQEADRSEQLTLAELRAEMNRILDRVADTGTDTV